jgi:hypothetical protein
MTVHLFAACCATKERNSCLAAVLPEKGRQPDDRQEARYCANPPWRMRRMNACGFIQKNKTHVIAGLIRNLIS